MRIIDKLTVIEKALPEGVELNGFYNVEVRRSEFFYRVGTTLTWQER